MREESHPNLWPPFKINNFSGKVNFESKGARGVAEPEIKFSGKRESRSWREMP